MSFGDGHTCHIEGICRVRIKMFDVTVRELQDVRCVPQLIKNLISVGVLEAQSLRVTLEECVLKMFSGSLVVLKGIQHNSLYYLKGSAITENLTASEQLDDDSAWHSRLGHVGLDSLQALAT